MPPQPPGMHEPGANPADAGFDEEQRLQGVEPGVDPLDADYTQSLSEEVLGPVFDHYFRPRIIGAERLPGQGPMILAVNHSGNTFPYDAIVLDGTLWRRSGFDPLQKFRSMYEKELSATWWMRPCGIDTFWRRAGAVDQTFANFDELLKRGDRLIYYPEGVPGIGKGFARRYQLQPFHTAFIVLAARHRAPVYPVHVVNAEWTIPFSFTFKWLDRLMDRLFHVPFLPLPWAIIAIVLPWAWYLALPARMIFKVGQPIDVHRLATSMGVTDFENPDRYAMQQLAEHIRLQMQAELTAAVAKYGNHPYQGRLLLRQLRRARGRLHWVLPTGWVVAFLRHDRNRRRGPARNKLIAFLRDFDLAAFYLPFGWPLLSLARAFRKPPYGYRGLSRRERRRVEGTYRWDLRTAPLPPRPDGTAPDPRSGPPAVPAPHPDYV